MEKAFSRNKLYNKAAEWSPDDNSSEEMHGIVDLGGDQIIQAVYHLKTFSHRAVECGTMEVLEASQRQHGRVNRNYIANALRPTKLGRSLGLMSVARIISRQDMSGADSEKTLADAFEFIQGSEVIARSRCLMVEVLKESDAVRVSAEILNEKLGVERSIRVDVARL